MKNELTINQLVAEMTQRVEAITLAEAENNIITRFNVERLCAVTKYFRTF